MTVIVETLEKLERKITLNLPVGTIQSEVETRLRKLARTVKMDGFRPSSNVRRLVQGASRASSQRLTNAG